MAAPSRHVGAGAHLVRHLELPEFRRRSDAHRLRYLPLKAVLHLGNARVVRERSLLLFARLGFALKVPGTTFLIRIRRLSPRVRAYTVT